MAHTLSAKKRLRQNKKRAAYNRNKKKDLRAHMKIFLKLLKEGNLDEARKTLSQCESKLDRMSLKRIYHPNKAARRKSQLAKIFRSKQEELAAQAANTSEENEDD